MPPPMSNLNTPEVTFSCARDGVNWQRLAEIFEQVGWGKLQPEKIEKAFRRSSFVRFAWSEEKLVGFGRTFDDGEFYGTICDLVVAPDYQGRGIGKRILRELQTEMKVFAFMTLTAAPGKHDFYLKEGWKRQSSAFIWPRSDKQAREHSD